MKLMNAKGQTKEVAAIAKLLHFAELSAEDLDRPFLVYLIRLARHEAATETLPSRKAKRTVNRRSAQASQNLN